MIDDSHLPVWFPAARRAALSLRATTHRAKGADHHVYVALLRDPRRLGRTGLYVGETSRDPDLRFDQHKTGYKASRFVNRFGISYTNQDRFSRTPNVFGVLGRPTEYLGERTKLDWRGNLEWLTGHFSKTFLGGMVPLLLGTITVMEIATGFLSAAGIVYFLATGSLSLIFYAVVLGAASLVALFFGQRVAKDYPGAAILVPYFILMMILIYLTNPFQKV